MLRAGAWKISAFSGVSGPGIGMGCSWSSPLPIGTVFLRYASAWARRSTLLVAASGSDSTKNTRRGCW
ncbi:Uncharacterised protein [Bordetella pertussis]|nr:Uncharacterised protein [Bordetella pertussis]CFV99604.1 Uncharacterised protein [Bordetella pertussis]